MNLPLLKNKELLYSNITNSPCEITDFIGSGGQGEVYTASYNSSKAALKWYYPHTATTEQKNILEILIKEGAPTERFLWPIEIVEKNKKSGFGYIMNLRPKQYKVMIGLMKRTIEPTFAAITTAGIQLADSFHKLHAKGLCYRDISYNNIFINDNTGDILICDNDNVTYGNKDSKTILGTQRFMAPEVVTGNSLPNRDTDLYSLAILLFYLLFISHPLEGKLEYNIKCLDMPAMNKLYGTDPVFIFDPINTTNRPVRGIHDNAIEYWSVYPEFIKKAFTKAFTEGIKDPKAGRVQETKWKDYLFKLRNQIIYCNCGAENFYDTENKKRKCWNCRKELVYPSKIKINKNIIMLNFDTKLYQCHLNDNGCYEFNTQIGQVVQNPQNPNIWGLKNLSKENWLITLKDGTQNIVPSGKTIKISDGSIINFGMATGEIKK